MRYRFYRDFSTEIRTDIVRLILQTEDPGIYRRGDAEDYPDIDLGKLQELVHDTVSREKRRALRVKKWMETPERGTTYENAIEGLRLESRELFLLMQECQDDGEFMALNEKFSVLTEQMRKLKKTFSIQNPWLQFYLTPREEHRALIGVIVKGHITDEAWLANPIYPVPKAYSHGMAGAKADIPIDNKPQGRGTQNGKHGRPRKQRPPLYVEPKIEIVGFEPVLYHLEYRDLLPTAWLGKKPE